MKSIRVEIYKNEELTNELNMGLDGLVDIMAAAIQGAGKAKIKHTGNDTANLIYTFTNKTYDNQIITYKYIYKDLPCTSGRIDTHKLRG